MNHIQRKRLFLILMMKVTLYTCFSIIIKKISLSVTDIDSKNDDVIVNELNASWSMNSDKLTLSNISFTVNKVRYTNTLVDE